MNLPTFETQPKEIRLYLDLPLSVGMVLEPDGAQAHYLLNVMRRREGDRIAIFNGVDGEWHGRIELVGRRRLRLMIEDQVRQQREEPGPILLFAPLKRTRQEFLIEKATELGVARLAPVLSHRSVVDRINRTRLITIAIEAAEQCGRLTVPEFDLPMPLMERLESWPDDRRLFYGDPTSDLPVLEALDEHGLGDFLIGPEGGFDQEELEELHSRKELMAVNLGPRILRAETAALAALACWQAVAAEIAD